MRMLLMSAQQAVRPLFQLLLGMLLLWVIKAKTLIVSSLIKAPIKENAVPTGDISALYFV
jgi:hypothetical protein